MKNALSKFAVACVLPAVVSCSEDSGGGTAAPGTAVTGTANKDYTLDLTVRGLVGEALSISWLNEEIIIEPTVFTERSVSVPADEFEAPDLNQPEFQHCNYETASVNSTRFTMVVECMAPHLQTLSVSSEGLHGELSIQWGDQSDLLSESNTTLNFQARHGRIIEPEIVSQPFLQSCDGEFVRSSPESFLFTYSIRCSDEPVDHIINISSALPYPVILSIADLTIDVHKDSRTIESFGPDKAELLQLGGTQKCELSEALFIEPETQNWDLNCEEFLVYNNLSSDSQGAFIAYKTGQPQLLQAGDIEPRQHAVPVFSSGISHLVLHPSFSVQELNTETDSWQAQDVLPLDQVVLTQNYAHAIAISNDGEERNVWRFDQEFNRSTMLGGITAEVVLNLLSVSPKQDVVGIDYLWPELIPNTEFNRQILVNRPDSPVFDLFNSYSQGPSFANIFKLPNYLFMFQAAENENTNELELELRTIIDGSISLGPHYSPDPITHRLVWYDDNIQERRLMLSRAFGNQLLPSPEFREFTLEDQLIDYAAPSGLEGFVDTVTYMGTDQQGYLLVLSAEHGLNDDVLAAMISAQTHYDISAIEEKVGNKLRVQLDISESAGLQHKKIAVYQGGWIFILAGEEDIGDIWITNGSPDQTWMVAENISWDEMNQNFFVSAGSASMVAVNYQVGTEWRHRLFR